MAEFHRMLKRRTAAEADSPAASGAARVTFQFQLFPVPDDGPGPRADETE